MNVKRLSISLWIPAFVGLFILVFGMALSAEAVPQPPNTFFGTVTIDGVLAADGTQIIVRAASSPSEVTTITTTVFSNGGNNGLYIAEISADDPDTASLREGGVNGDTVTFELINGVLLNETGTYASGQNTNLNLTGVSNNPPVAVDDTYDTDEDTTLNIAAPGVLDNDSDIDPHTLAAAVNADVSNGTLTLNGDGSFDYVPNADFNGTDIFTYDVSDGNSGTATGTVTITVNAVNDAPVAVDNTDTTNEDTAVTVNVIANDTDIDLDSLNVDSVGTATSGTVTTDNANNVIYTPNADFNGTDSFTYVVTDGSLTDTGIVTITVNAVNDAPVAVDNSDTTDEDTAITVDVITNDTDIDLDSLNVDSVGTATNGAVTTDNANNVTYTPAANFNGTDSFTYVVSDGALTDTGIVTITVNAVNDAPIAVDDTDTTSEETAVTVDVIGNDTDVDLDGLNVASVSTATNGTVTTDNANNVTYTPAANFNGTDSFTYVVSDGSLTDTGIVTITVNAANDAPVAVDDSDTTNEDTAITVDVIANDSDIDLDSLNVASVGTAANGTVTTDNTNNVTYTPALNFHGTDSFTYTVSDGSLSDTGLVTIAVNAVADLVTANADFDIMFVNETLSAFAPGVMGNDVDIDGDATVVLTANGTRGNVTLNADGSFDYTPIAGFVGTDIFTYTISNSSFSSVGEVSVLVLIDPAQPVEIPLPTAGWHLFGYPFQQSQPVEDALASIAGQYSTVYGWDGTDSADNWKMHDETIPPPFDSFMNDLSVLEFGEAYRITVDAPVTIILSNGGRSTAVTSRSVNNATAPATFYGYLNTAVGQTLTAWVDGVTCGSATTQTAPDGRVMVGIHVEPFDGVACGSAGDLVTFTLDGVDAGISAEWQNGIVEELNTAPTAITLQTAQVPTPNTILLIAIGIVLAATIFVYRRATAGRMWLGG